MSIGSTKVTDFGVNEYLQSGSINEATTGAVNNNLSTSLDIGGSLGSSSASFAVAASASAVAASVNTQSDSTGVSAQAITYASLSGTVNNAVSFDIQGTNSSAVTVSANVNSSDYTELSQAINAVSGQTGITAVLSDDKASLTLVQPAGEDIKITAGVDGSGNLDLGGVDADGVTAAGAGVGITSATGVTVGGNISFYSPKGFTVESGTADTSIAAASGSPEASGLLSVFNSRCINTA